MLCVHGSLVGWILLAIFVPTHQYQRPNSKSNSDNGLKSVCLGNVMRLTLDKELAVGSQLELEAINGSDIIQLSSTLAAQCGYSMESDPWGNTKIFASLSGCFVSNQADSTFHLGLRLRMYGDNLPQPVEYEVKKMCNYSPWASREVLCDRNYMEVSTLMVPTVTHVRTQKGHRFQPESSSNAIPDSVGAPNSIWKMAFHTPEMKVMVLEDFLKSGYGAMTTQKRLVLRSPYNMAETYSEEVAGVPMEVFSVSTYYKEISGLTVMDSVAACPTGGVLFTDDVITWHIPRRISPLISGPVKILDTFMGIDGQRLDKAKMSARHYRMSITSTHIVVEIPVGSPDGYYKSHAPDEEYHVTFTIEPMLEFVWKAENTQSDTRYKVLFPITTPMMLRSLHVIDYTIPEQKVFDVLLGPFLQDVELMNFNFSIGVLTVAECNARGFDVKEHRFANGSKTFSLRVPFSDEVVQTHNPDPLITTYYLPMVFGLLILPEQTPFQHLAEVEASLEDVVIPTITGSCDQKNFYVSVKYGSGGANFQTMMLNAGSWRELDSDLATLYSLSENDTHFSLTVPHLSPDTTFEVIHSNSILARVDLLLLQVPNMWKLNDFSLACFFPLTTTECFSNGTMTALAVKVESVHNLDPEHLTLRDQSCKPAFSSDRFAWFSFNLNSCGTTRTFFDNVMVYENEITMHQSTRKHGSAHPEYRHVVSCYYLLNDTKTMDFRTTPRTNDPIADPGVGHLVVKMTLSKDASYEDFYQAEDYPVVKYLREPLYFEVALMQSSDSQIQLVLENCWATLHEDRTSVPSWDLVVDSCENLDDRYLTVFHPVIADSRVLVPSHVKRFSIKMFTFARDETVVKGEVFVHCEAVLCDITKPHGICSGQCANPQRNVNPRPTSTRRERRNAGFRLQKKHQVSSGLILLSDLI
ncbi:hypothetical protein DPEC_G00319640 [Dallia pectoralis]|uniref:Uncharacterized protein n=1 Tax=Dallia pectoralis TaxID=75939 RepID=A0ACC2F9V2_DALPE|nr:hypothetical protein DPEC_G00319640 [Dallia pectoralis]